MSVTVLCIIWCSYSLTFRQCSYRCYHMQSPGFTGTQGDWCDTTVLHDHSGNRIVVDLVLSERFQCKSVINLLSVRAA